MVAKLTPANNILTINNLKLLCQYSQYFKIGVYTRVRIKYVAIQTYTFVFHVNCRR